MTLPLVLVFAVLVWLCVKFDKMRIHHAVVCVIFGIGLGVSIWGGDIWAALLWIWHRASEIGTTAS